MAFEWSQEQTAYFDWIDAGAGSLVLEAVAGAGKTTVLVGGMRRMRGDVFYGVFNRKNAEEAKRKVADLPRVEAATFHSAGFKCLRRAAGSRLTVETNKVRNLVTARLENTERKHWIRAVTELVAKAKMSGFGVREVMESPKRRDWMNLIVKFDVLDMIEDEIDPNRLMDEAIAVLCANNEQRDVIDQEDMIYQTLLRGLRPYRHDWVLIDEAQDSSATRIELARRMLKPGGRLVAVGDPHQAIFGFAGAESDSLDKIRETFSAATMRLSVTYRCPKAVVAVARDYVSHIHAAATAPEGEHQEMAYAEMVKFSSPGDAILCRLTAPIVELCFALIRSGKPARIEGRNVGEGLAKLAGRWRVKHLTALEGKLESYLERESTKLLAKDDELGLERLRDTVATLRCLIDRSREEGVTTVAGLQTLVRSMFGDTQDGAADHTVVLSSVHRAKGLEWERVFLLGRAQLMPSRRARQDWQVAQEINLCYVACTRAKRTLVDVPLQIKAAPAEKTAEASATGETVAPSEERAAA